MNGNWSQLDMTTRLGASATGCSALLPLGHHTGSA